jgi:hypothetical protein
MIKYFFDKILIKRGRIIYRKFQKIRTVVNLRYGVLSRLFKKALALVDTDMT